MKCLKCQADNADNQLFCGQCGAKLEKICPDCGASNPIHYKYCGKCSHELSVTKGKKHVLRNLLIAFACIFALIAVGFVLANTVLPAYQHGATVYAPVQVPQSPSAPSNVSGHANSCSQMTITWMDTSYNEDGFRIYRNGTLAGSVGSNVTRFQDTGLQYGTTYSYNVAAYNSVGETKSATTVQAKTLNPPIIVTLDRIGVISDHDPFLKGAGEIYLILCVGDGQVEPVTIRVPSNAYISLNDNETMDVEEQIFSTACVGDQLSIQGIAFESDDPIFEGVVNIAGQLILSEIGGPVASFLTMFFSQGQPTEDNPALSQIRESPADDLVGAVDKTWTSSKKWGLGSYEEVTSGDLRLWFTISVPK
jgi:ribosomal protein L40E